MSIYNRNVPTPKSLVPQQSQGGTSTPKLGAASAVSSDLKHGTLVSSTVATVTLDGEYSAVKVTNLTGGSDPIFFTVDGSAPTDAGEDTYSVAALAGASRTVGVSVTGTTVVRLISAGTPEYTVESA